MRRSKCFDVDSNAFGCFNCFGIGTTMEQDDKFISAISSRQVGFPYRCFDANTQPTVPSKAKHRISVSGKAVSAG